MVILPNLLNLREKYFLLALNVRKSTAPLICWLTTYTADNVFFKNFFQVDGIFRSLEMTLRHPNIEDVNGLTIQAIDDLSSHISDILRHLKYLEDDFL